MNETLETLLITIHDLASARLRSGVGEANISHDLMEMIRLTAAAQELCLTKDDVVRDQYQRDLFAMSAMTGLMANTAIPPLGLDPERAADRFAEAAYRAADAMLEARKAPKNG